MPDQRDPKLPTAGAARVAAALRRGAAWAGGCVSLAGALSLAGRALDLQPVWSRSPAVSMKANSALAFVFAGLALALQAPAMVVRRRLIWARVAALAAATIGLLSASEYLLGLDLGIDQLLFIDTVDAAADRFPGRMSPLTAVAFLASGLALYWYSAAGRAARLALGLVAPLLTLAALSLIGHLYDVGPFYGSTLITAMPVTTALTFLLLGGAMLAARPDRGLARLVLTEGQAGILTRVLLPAAVVTPVVIGWLRLKGEQAGLYNAQLGSALVAVAIGAIFVALVLWMVRSIATGERQLREHAVELEQARTRIEYTAQLLHRAEERLRIAVTGAGIGTWHLAVDSGAVEWSDRCRALFGIPPDQPVTYQSTIAAIHPDDRARNDAAVQRALSERSEYHSEFRVVWPDGSVHWLASRGLGHYDDSGRALRLAGVLIDIDERKRAEQELRQATAAAEAANRELESFSYSVSHDLRAPLRAIDGFSQALLEDYGNRLDATATDFLRRVRAGAQRMAELIDDLLRLSRLSRAELVRERIDLSAVASAVARELGERDPLRDVRIEIEPGLSADADRQLLLIVLENLLGNAWKFTSKTPAARIQVSIEERDGKRLFCVRDNGAGFDMAYLEKLFGAFQRLHHERDFEGTGIGLATVARIVHRHGGEISAEGAVGGGAAFFFSFGAPARSSTTSVEAA